LAASEVPLSGADEHEDKDEDKNEAGAIRFQAGGGVNPAPSRPRPQCRGGGMRRRPAL